MSSLSSRKAHSPPPFRPSRLSISTGPLSPAAPLTPPGSQSCSPPKITITCPTTPPMESTTPPPPQRPLPWLWTCHQCGTTYPLAATRRCLSDGHYFCSGTTYNPRTGRTKRHRSCSSEFDYVGWKAWSEWREDCAQPTPRRPLKRATRSQTHTHDQGCWTGCNYPSECRWRTRIDSPVSPIEVPSAQELAEPLPSVVSQATKDDIVDQVVKEVKKRRRNSAPKLAPIQEEELLQLQTPQSGDISETPLSPTSPLKQHYTLPTFDFPSPPQSHMPHGLFTLAEVEDEDADEADDFFASYADAQSGSSGERSHVQGDWMDLSSSSSSDEEDEDVESLVSDPSSASSASSEIEYDGIEGARGGIRIIDYARTEKGFEVYVEEDVDMEDA